MVQPRKKWFAQYAEQKVRESVFLKLYLPINKIILIIFVIKNASFCCNFIAPECDKHYVHYGGICCYCLLYTSDAADE